MWKKTFLLIFVICFLLSTAAKKKRNKAVFKYRYPELFRDHVYRNLSENGKEVFYAVNIHPSCVAKKGYCIPRAKCVGKDMLYLSRICYKRDLVCCYDSSIRFPEVADKYYTPPTRPVTSTTVATTTTKSTTMSTNSTTQDSQENSTTVEPPTSTTLSS